MFILLFWGHSVVKSLLRETIFLNLALCYSTKSGGKLTSLDKYISRMKSGQKDIFYITGTSKDQLEKSPFLERLSKKGYEVTSTTCLPFAVICKQLFLNIQ